MVAQQVATSDIVLVVTLTYLAFDICCEWEGFASCPKPIHKWLLVSYLLVVMTRIVVSIAAASQTPESGSFLINFRQKGTMSKFLFSLVWLVLVPLFAMWTALGSLWTWELLSESPQCMPSGMHLASLLVCQVLSYAWIFVYSGLGALACSLERRLRRAETDLQDLQDADVMQRWGDVGRLDGYTSLPATMKGGCLSPGQIKQLSGASIRSEGEATEEDCPICLTSICCGDSVRQLTGCKHVFHRACVDLWLLRSSECPMCKQRVVVNDPKHQ